MDERYDDLHAPSEADGSATGVATTSTAATTVADPPLEESDSGRPGRDRGTPDPSDRSDRAGAGYTARIVTIILVIAAALVGGGIRAWLLFHQPVTSDEAVAGLISHQILHGHTYAFFWGQPFGGVEPYVVAAVFAVLGQSSLTLGVAPILLSALAAVLVWRVALRLVDSPMVALLAGALAWAAPFPVVFTSTVEGGYRGVTLACGLAILLISLRILDGKFRLAEFVVLGLVTGVGWWSLPEIVYFLIPAGLVLVGAMARSWRAGDLSRWAGRVGLAVVAFFVGSLPWWWTNLGSGFASLDTSKFPGSVTPLNPGYGGRLRIFFRFTLPLYANLRRLNTGVWLFGGSGTSGHGVWVALAVVVLVVAAAAALVLCLLRGGRCIALVVAVVLYPFLVALQPGTWFWQDGRYAVYLGPLLALVLAVACVELAQRVGRRSRSTARRTPTHRPSRRRVTGVGLMGAVLALALVLTAVDFHQSFAVSGHELVTHWGNPDADPAATAAELEAKGVRDGYADYWVAYKLDFLSRGALSLTVAGTDPDRWQPLDARVEHATRPAWLFVPPDRIPEGLAQFAQTGDIQGPSGLTEADFLGALNRLGIPYTTVVAGPVQAVIPASPVQLHNNGSVTAR